jgi:protein-L-isoaspartate(D-aspartate) O-methyltransferase
MGKGRALWFALLVAVCALIGGARAADDTAAAYAERRAAMLEVIQSHAGAGYSAALAPAISPAVIAAMSRVERHEFVPEALRDRAYEDRPLPIGYGQTISQPYIVALMTDLLEPGPGDRLLEVGTGSGYQAAVLAELGLEVYTIEIVPELAEQAAARLERLGYDKAATRVGDGYHGWPERAPFDGIVVTAAADHVPPPLVAQLRPGGRMVIPVGPAFMVQQLVLVTKAADGTLRTRQLLPVRFVPLTGRH